MPHKICMSATEICSNNSQNVYDCNIDFQQCFTEWVRVQHRYTAMLPKCVWVLHRCESMLDTICMSDTEVCSNVAQNMYECYRDMHQRFTECVWVQHRCFTECVWVLQRYASMLQECAWVLQPCSSMLHRIIRVLQRYASMLHILCISTTEMCINASQNLY